ncbi:MAG: amidohydrolase [Hyphomonadaceae bacterium]|nr:amidohydrolase [Hyphomonadaceae bacterium]
MKIDIHSHVLPRIILEALADNPSKSPFPVARADDGYTITGYGRIEPGMYDLDLRCSALDDAGIARQYFAPPPPILSHYSHAIPAEFATVLNTANAAVTQTTNSRLIALATPALADPAETAPLLERAVGEFGFPGVALPTSAGARDFDDPAFEPMWSVIERLGLTVFMHATSRADHPAAGNFNLGLLVSWPTEVTYAASRLIFSGVMERHPDLKIILSHGGGTLPALIQRLDLGYHAPDYEHDPECSEHIAAPPSRYLRNFHFDTVVGGGPALRALIDSVGYANIVFGTDYPYEVGDADGSRASAIIDDLPVDIREAIYRNNAARLFPQN